MKHIGSAISLVPSRCYGTHNVGDEFEAHHDQTMRRLGNFKVVAKVSHADIGQLPAKGSLPLLVYK